MSIERREGPRRVRYEVRYRAPDGSERSRTFRTDREARAFEGGQRAARDRGAWVDPRASTTKFGDVASDWSASNPAKRSSSIARDETELRCHLLPAIGERPAAAVTLPGRDEPRGELRSDRSLAVPGIKLPKAAQVSRPMITAEQLVALADALGDCRLMVYMGAVLGMRWGEVAGLRVGAVDVQARTVAVREQLIRGRYGISELGPPKSDAGRRVITMPVELAESLDHQLAGDPEAFVFPAPDGGFLTYSNWRQRCWEPACKAAGVEGLGFHDLRRLSATGLVAEGIDIKTAQTAPRAR